MAGMRGGAWLEGPGRFVLMALEMRAFLLVLTLFLTACAAEHDRPVVPEALAFGTIKPVFSGTTRARDEHGLFGYGRSFDLSLLELAISIPEARAAGSVTTHHRPARPGRDFAIADMTEFRSAAGFRTALSRDMARNGTRDVTVYVHGFNNSFSDAAFRIAQLTHDLNIPGTAVSYAWPSRASPLGYNYDTDSALFARDGLVDLLREIRAAGARQIVLVGHSMGGALVMETLRQIEIKTPGWAAANLAGVLLISPDQNVDVFRAQGAAFKKWPQPFVVFVSSKDIFLRLSARIRGERVRLGNLEELSQISDLPITFVDVTDLADGELGNHFTAGGSEAFVRLMRAPGKADAAFLRGLRKSVIPGARRLVRSPGASGYVLIPAEDR